jgi:hypothetical protein
MTLTARAGAAAASWPRRPSSLGVDGKVILTPPCIFCMENTNGIYRVVSE